MTEKLLFMVDYYWLEESWLMLSGSAKFDDVVCDFLEGSLMSEPYLETLWVKTWAGGLISTYFETYWLITAVWFWTETLLYSCSVIS